MLWLNLNYWKTKWEQSIKTNGARTTKISIESLSPFHQKRVILLAFIFSQSANADTGAGKYFTAQENPISEFTLAHLLLHYFGNVHHALVHLPIAFGLLLPLLDHFSANLFDSSNGERIRSRFLWLAWGCALITIASGLCQATKFELSDPNSGTIVWHRAAAIATFTLFSLILMARKRPRARRALAWLLAVFVLLTGFLGGIISFGPWIGK